MFKVQENGDGSTSIFCNKSGSLICTIKSQQKNMGLGCRPVNVVGPSPQPRSHCFNLDLKSGCSSDDDQKLNSKKRSLSPLRDEPKEDFYDDCITPEEFARCLNLVPTKKFKAVSLDQLNSTFPLRHQSRTHSPQISEDVQDLKLSDDLPLTSSFGVKLLKLNQQRNFYCDQAISMKIKNYDSFCRFQLNTPSACSNFPKLRCREKKEYPVYLSQKFSKNGSSHMYAFNRRQRIEKMLTFKTGLNFRSRRLLRDCNSKKIAISLKRLAPEEVQSWLSKKSGIIRPITMDCIKDEIPIVHCSDSEATVIEEISLLSASSADSSDSSSSSDSDYSPVSLSLNTKIVSFKGILAKSEKYLSPSKNRIGQYSNIKTYSFKCKDCYVNLNNVLWNISKYLGSYYINGTRIRIPYLSDYLTLLDPKSLTMNLVMDSDLLPSTRYDHAYHIPFSSHGATRKNSLCLNDKSSKARHKIKETPKMSSSATNRCTTPKSNIPSKLNIAKTSLHSHVNNTKAIKSKEIPVVDLTYSPPKQSKCASNWIFKCYGCGQTKGFASESALKVSGIEHLKKFHCVFQTDSFLKQNSTASGAVLEAFPGYKESLK